MSLIRIPEKNIGLKNKEVQNAKNASSKAFTTNIFNGNVKIEELEAKVKDEAIFNNSKEEEEFLQRRKSPSASKIKIEYLSDKSKIGKKGIKSNLINSGVELKKENRNLIAKRKEVRKLIQMIKEKHKRDGEKFNQKACPKKLRANVVRQIIDKNDELNYFATILFSKLGLALEKIEKTCQL